MNKVLGSIAAKLVLDVSNFKNNLEKAQSDVQKTTRSFKQFGSTSDAFTQVGSQISKVSVAAGGLLTMSTKVYSNFTTSMSKVKALSGATGEEYEQLSKKAREMGASTIYSASESADALGYMALAGWNTSQMVDGLDGVLNLAAASQMDLAQASDIVTDYISAFGMQASDATKVANIFAYAQSKSNMNTEQLADAFKNCAASANAYGWSMEEVTGVLAMFANQGLKGSEAGTALNAMMRDMIAGMKDGKIAIGNTTVEVANANGKFRSYVDIVRDIEKATNGMSDAQKAAALQQTFTSDSMKGFNLILSAGSDELEKFTNALGDVDGVAKEMADTMNDNLKGDIAELQSALEEAGISLAEIFEPALRKCVQAVTKLVNVFNGLPKPVKAVTAGVLGFTSVLGPMLLILGKMPGVLATLRGGLAMLPFGKIALAAGIAGAAFLAFNKDARETAVNVVKKVYEMCKQMINTLVQKAPEFIAQGKQMVVGLIKGITEKLPEIVSKGEEIIDHIIRGVMTAIPNLIAWGGQIISNLVNAITSHLPQIAIVGLSIISKLIEGFNNYIAPLAQWAYNFIFNIIDTIIKYLPQIYDLGIQLQVKLIEGLSSMLPNVVSFAFEIIGKICDVIVEYLPKLFDMGVKMIGSIIDGIIQSLPSVLECISNILMQIIQFIIDYLPQFVDAGVKMIGSIIDGIVSKLPDLINALAEGLINLLYKIIEMLPSFIDAGFKIINSIADGIVQMAPKILSIMLDTITKLLGTIAENLPSFIDKGIDVINHLANGIVQNGPSLISKMFDLIGQLLRTIIAHLPEFGLKGIEIVFKLIDGIARNQDKLLAIGGKLIIALIRAMGAAIGGFFQIGVDIVRGVWDGIKSLWNSLCGWVEGKVNWLKDKLTFWNSSKSKMQENWKGTSYAQAGPSMIAEKGPELLQDKDGNLRLFTSPSVTMLQGGEKIYTAAETRRLFKGGASSALTSIANLASVASKAASSVIKGSSEGAMLSDANKSSLSGSGLTRSLLAAIKTLLGKLDDKDPGKSVNLTIENFNNNRVEDIKQLISEIEYALV